MYQLLECAQSNTAASDKEIKSYNSGIHVKFNLVHSKVSLLTEIPEVINAYDRVRMCDTSVYSEIVRVCVRVSPLAHKSVIF